TPEFEAAWREVARQVRAHLDSKPQWHQVMKVAFLNGLDESYNEAAYEKMLYYGKLLHEAMGRGWFKYRVDGGYSREAMEKLSAEVELWVCHTVSFDADTVDYFRKRGVDAWFYGPMIYEQRRNSGCGSNTFLDLDLLVNRAIGWVGWKYRSGCVEWEFDWNAYASWYEAKNFKEPGQICVITPSLGDIECHQYDLALLSCSYPRFAGLGGGRRVLRIQGAADSGCRVRLLRAEDDRSNSPTRRTDDSRKRGVALHSAI